MPRPKRKPERLLPPYVFEKAERWYVRINIPTLERTATGRLIYCQVVRACIPKTAERAKEIIEALTDQVDEATVDAAREPTLADFIENRFLPAKKVNIARRTYSHYLDLFEGHIKNASIGRTELTAVTPSHAQDYVTSLLSRGVSADMVRRLYTFLSMAYKQAMIWRMRGVEYNPMRGVLLPPHEPKESVAMTSEEAKRLLKVLRSDDRYIIFELALETGLRPQECLALRWQDVDLKRNRLWVNQATVEGVRGGGIHIEPPKTESSKAVVTFSHQLAARLSRQREIVDKRIEDLRKEIDAPLSLGHFNARRGVRYQERKLHRELCREAVKNLREVDLIFPSLHGTPQSRNNVNRRLFKDALAKAGLDTRRYSFKTLRHTSASLLAHVLPPKLLQQRLRHKKVETTMKFYQHFSERDQAAFVDRFTEEFYTED